MPVALIAVLVTATLAAVVLLELRGENAARRIVAAILILALAASTAYIVLETERQSAGTGSPASSRPTTNPSVAESVEIAPSAAPSVAPVRVRYEATLPPGEYTLFRVGADGSVDGQRSTSFDRPSMAPVDRVEAPNGSVYWRTVLGDLAGLSYIPERSGPFGIREIIRWPDGTIEQRVVDPQS